MSKITKNKNKQNLYEIAVRNGADTSDIGIYGKYFATTDKYTGLFRDASDGKYSLFKDLEEKPTFATVNIAGTGFSFADLNIGELNASGNLNTAGYLQLDDISAPANPADNEGRLYKKTGDDGIFWKPDSAGSEVDISGDVAGPASTTDNLLVRFDGTTGKLIQDSLGSVNNAGVLTGLTGMSMTGNSGDVLTLRNTNIPGDLVTMVNSNGTNVAQFNKNGSDEIVVRFNRDTTGNPGFFYKNGELKLGDTTSTALPYTLNIDTGDVNVVSGSYRLNGVPIDLNDLNSVVLTSLASGELLEYNGINWVNVPRSIACDIYYDPIIETALPIGTWTDIPLNTERVKDTDFTHAANAANITFNTAGRYSVTARCSTFITSGSTRSQCQMRIMLDTGVGFTQIPGAIGFMYSKEVTEGYNTATVNFIQTFSVADIIKLQAITSSGSTSVRAVAEGSSIVIQNA